MRRCGLFYISTLVTITITRKEFVINFLMFKHNIFLLLVFDSVSQRPVLYCFLVFFFLNIVVFVLMLLARLCCLKLVSFTILVNTTSEQSIRGPAVVEPSSNRRHRRRTTGRPGQSGAA